MNDRLSEQIATLPSLDKSQLLAIWAENFSKDPPPNLRKELIVSTLDYRIFLGVVLGVFAGVFGKVVCRTWCFDGVVVVDCMVNVVC